MIWLKIKNHIRCHWVKKLLEPRKKMVPNTDVSMRSSGVSSKCKKGGTIDIHKKCLV